MISRRVCLLVIVIALELHPLEFELFLQIVLRIAEQHGHIGALRQVFDVIELDVVAEEQITINDLQVHFDFDLIRLLFVVYLNETVIEQNHLFIFPLFLQNTTKEAKIDRLRRL